MKVMVWGMIAVLGFAPAAFCADEVIEAMDQAKEQYTQNNYSQAINYLNHASTLINQKQQQNIATNAFPAPVQGWTVEEAEGVIAGQALFGGGSVTTRIYRKDEMEVEMTVMANSPMVSSMLMLLNSPMIAASSPNYKSVMVKGERGLLKTERKTYELSVILDNQILVSYKGRNLPDENFLNLYAQQTDFKAVRASVRP